MSNEKVSFGFAPNGDVALSRKGQATKILGQETPILYDLVDLTNLLKVTARTIFNWRAKGIINLMSIGGRLYMTPKMLQNFLEGKGGIL